jgi:hypothetical protein
MKQLQTIHSPYTDPFDDEMQLLLRTHTQHTLLTQVHTRPQHGYTYTE